MICPVCQRENPDENAYCGGCGARLGGLARSPQSYTPRHLASHILTTRSALEGERKQVTVLFADVMDSTAISAGLDPEDWHRVMDRFLRVLADGVHRFEGTVNQFTGDGIMALFGAPIAHEDHARRACYAALQLVEDVRRFTERLRRQKLEFTVRMGLNSGEVVVGKIGDDLRMDYTAQGHATALASRVEQIAEPGTVYLTEHTARLVEGYFELRDRGKPRLKGAPPLRVFELVGPGELRTRLDASRAHGLTSWVGRDPELATLESALGRALQGEGRVVSVVGEAGVGKSRLCHEFAERARARGVAVYEAACPAHGRTVPLLPVRQLLRAWLGVAEEDSAESVRAVVSERLLALDAAFSEAVPLVHELLGVAQDDATSQWDDTERARRLADFAGRWVQRRSVDEPAVLIVDDVHWIDDESERLLARMAEALGWTRTLLVASFRSELRSSFAQPEWGEVMEIEPLEDDASAALISSLLGDDPSLEDLAPRILARTRGNPFFAEEVIESLAAGGQLEGGRGGYRLAGPVEDLEIPASVQVLLAARIDRLAERHKYVLQTASVIGRRFGRELLEAVVELPPDELADSLTALEAGDLVRATTLFPSPEYEFRHPLTHEVAYGMQLRDIRQRVHVEVARALEALHPDRLGELAALLAHHWDSAGHRFEARRWRQRVALRVSNIQIRRRRKRS